MTKSIKKLKVSVFLLVFFYFSILLSPLNVIFSQETSLENNDQAAEIRDVEGLRAEFKQNTQDPDSKIVKFEMVLKSNIDSDRVQLNWKLNGNAVFVNEKEATKNFKIENGKSYSLAIEIKPLGKGSTELLGTVESFKVDATFQVTARKNFATNADAEILPITNEYSSAKTLSTIKNIVFIVVLIFIIIFAGSLGVKKFARWINKEEKVEYGVAEGVKPEEV